MVEKLSRGWALTRQSARVVKENPSLAVLPVLSMLFGFVVVVVIAAPTAIVTGLFTDTPADDNDPVFYIAFAAAIYVCTFTSIFFNVALAACAGHTLRGEKTSLRAGIAVAARRVVPIVGWALLSATIGLVLRAVQDRTESLGRLAAWLAGAAWAVATFFVIPLIAAEGHGPLQSVKRSGAIIKERWGEGAAGTAAIGAVSTIALVAVTLLGAGGFFWFSDTEALTAFVFLGVGLLLALLIYVISSALTGVFRVAVYQYTTTGETRRRFRYRTHRDRIDTEEVTASVCWT